MALNHSPRIVTDGLVLCLDAANRKSYPGSGTAWYDLSGNGNDATLVNGVTYTSDYQGGLTFDGADDYGESGVIEPQQLTVSCWFMDTGPGTNNDFGGAILVTNSSEYVGTLTYFLTHSWLEQTIRFGIQANVGGVITRTCANNQIHNAVGTFGDGFQKLYLNGELIGQVSRSQALTYPTSGNRNVQIGRWGYGGFPRILNGKIYNAQIYERVLSAQEIAQNFQALRGRYGI